MIRRGTCSVEKNGKSGHVFDERKGRQSCWNVGWYSVISSCCFYPLLDSLFLSPSSPFWHRMPVFMACLETLPPPSPRRVQWNSWIVFSRGFTSLSSFDFQPTFFAVEKKNKEKKERNRLFEFFKTYYYEVEKYTLRSFRLSFFLIIVEVISIDSYIYHWKIMESISWNSIKCIARVLEIIKEVCCVT